MPQDTESLIEREEHHTPTWNQTISSWINNSIGSNINYLIKGNFWLGTTIAGMTTLNIVSNKIALNQELKWNEITDELIEPVIIGTTAASLIISVIKNSLTNLSSLQLAQTDTCYY